MQTDTTLHQIAGSHAQNRQGNVAYGTRSIGIGQFEQRVVDWLDDSEIPWSALRYTVFIVLSQTTATGYKGVGL